STPAASARAAWARPISPPSATDAFRAMFCALKGATRMRARTKSRQRAAVRRLLPTPEPVPWTIRHGASPVICDRASRSPPRSPCSLAPGRPATLPLRHPARRLSRAGRRSLPAGRRRRARRARDGELDRRLETEGRPPAVFLGVEETVLESDREVAGAGVVALAAQSHDGLASEPRLERAGQSGAKRELRREAAVALATPDRGLRVLDPRLELRHAWPDGLGVVRHARPVGRDRGVGARGAGRAEREQARDDAERPPPPRPPHLGGAGVAPTERAPELRPLPAGLGQASPLVVEVRAREEDRDHLLGAAV